MAEIDLEYQNHRNPMALCASKEQSLNKSRETLYQYIILRILMLAGTEATSKGCPC